MTESRKQFEEWAIKEDFDTDYGSYTESEYNSIFTQIAWESWQASRASIVVTLPETHNDWLDKQIVQHALKKEGIRYE